MTLVLSIKTNLNEYTELINNKKFINTTFKSRISLYNANYRLIGLIIQPCYDHFISYFEKIRDLHDNYNYRLYKYDAFIG